MRLPNIVLTLTLFACSLDCKDIRTGRDNVNISEFFRDGLSLPSKMTTKIVDINAFFGDALTLPYKLATKLGDLVFDGYRDIYRGKG